MHVIWLVADVQLLWWASWPLSPKLVLRGRCHWRVTGQDIMTQLCAKLEVILQFLDTSSPFHWTNTLQRLAPVTTDSSVCHFPRYSGHVKFTWLDETRSADSECGERYWRSSILRILTVSSACDSLTLRLSLSCHQRGTVRWTVTVSSLLVKIVYLSKGNLNYLPHLRSTSGVACLGPSRDVCCFIKIKYVPVVLWNLCSSLFEWQNNHYSHTRDVPRTDFAVLPIQYSTVT